MTTVKKRKPGRPKGSTRSVLKRATFKLQPETIDTLKELAENGYTRVEVVERGIKIFAASLVDEAERRKR